MGIFFRVSYDLQIAAMVFLAPRLAFFCPFLAEVMKTAFVALVRNYIAVFDHFHIFFALIRNELLTTDTLEDAMASPANTGFRSQPKIG